MIELVLSQIQALMQAARDDYGVDPVIFLVIYFASAPVFYYSLFRTIRALARQAGKEIMLWSFVFLLSTVAPFVYVLFFGRNLPWWVYAVMVLIAAQGIFSLVRTLRRPHKIAQREQ